MAMISMKEAMKRLQSYGPKTRVTLDSYAESGKIPADRTGRLWTVDEDYILKAIEWRKTVKTREELIEEASCFHTLDDREKKLCRRNVGYKTKHLILHDETYGLLFGGTFISAENVPALLEMIDKEVDAIRKKRKGYTAEKAGEKLGLSTYQVKSMIKKGEINAEQAHGKWIISQEQADAVTKKKSGYIGIYDLVKDRLEKEPIRSVFNLDNPKDRMTLNLFLRNSKVGPFLSSWAELGLHDDRRNAWYFATDLAALVWETVKLFILRYGLSEERYKVFDRDPFWKTHPETRALLDRFSEKKPKIAIVALMQILIEALPAEITACTNEEIAQVLTYAASFPVKTYASSIVKFLNYVRAKQNCKFDMDFSYDKKSGRTNTVNDQPYTFSQYLLASYMAFNDDFIKDHHLTEKALESPKYAYLWLSVCWSYVTAWRTSDFNRLHILPLLDSKEEVVKKIKSGEYGQMAIKMSLLLESEINDRERLPHKTQDKQNSSFLVAEIAESLRPIIGLVYSICVLHSKDQKLQTFRLEVKDFVDFFGPDYRKIFGNSVFLNRRANKSYLDAISEIVEKNSETANKTRGYLIAAFARAHVSKEELLAQMTSKYLRTKLDGLTSDEVIFRLFETGTCSFLIGMALELVYGEKYSNLGVAYQNELIKAVPESPYEIEKLMMTLRDSYATARKTCSELFKGYGEQESKAVGEKMLKAVLSKKALCRGCGISCAKYALGDTCPYPQRTDGLGCKYAIYHHGIIIYAVQKLRDAYDRLSEAQTEGERRKWSMLIDGIYLPAILEIITVAQATGIAVEDYGAKVLELITKKREVKKNDLHHGKGSKWNRLP